MKNNSNRTILSSGRNSWLLKQFLYSRKTFQNSIENYFYLKVKYMYMYTVDTWSMQGRIQKLSESATRKKKEGSRP